jgi:hypothetical protein
MKAEVCRGELSDIDPIAWGRGYRMSLVEHSTPESIGSARSVKR